MTTFNLPDLGEGLPEAEIVAWHVKEGDSVDVDQPMLSVETAKAVVEVPSPYKGKITKLHAKAGDTVETGKPLVEFEGAAGAAKAAPEKESRGAQDHDPAPPSSSSGQAASAGQGMVVGHMASSDEEFVDRAIAGGLTQRRTQGRVRAAPAVRMLAKRLNVSLQSCRATGRHGLVS